MAFNGCKLIVADFPLLKIANEGIFNNCEQLFYVNLPQV